MLHLLQVETHGKEKNALILKESELQDSLQRVQKELGM